MSDEKHSEGGKEGEAKGGKPAGGGHGGKKKGGGGGGGGGHGEGVNLERWLVSYADFMTLLFAVFVMLFAMSSVNNSKAQQLAQAIMMSLNGKAEYQAQDVSWSRGGPFEASVGITEQSGRDVIEDMAPKKIAPVQEQTVNLQSLADFIDEILRMNLTKQRYESIKVRVVEGMYVKVQWPDEELFDKDVQIQTANYAALENLANLTVQERCYITIDSIVSPTIPGLGNFKNPWPYSSEKTMNTLRAFTRFPNADQKMLGTGNRMGKVNRVDFLFSTVRTDGDY